MNDLPLVIRNDAARSIEFTGEANRLRSAALEKAAMIGRVSDAIGNAAATEAQLDIATVLKTVETVRKEVKEPVLRFGQMIDDTAKAFVVDLKAEQMRLNKLVGDFQALEQAKQRAAQQAENQRLAQLERERAAEAAKVTTHEELEAVQEKYNARAAQEAPIAPRIAPRAQGQVVSEKWVYDVSDMWLLAKSHPTCVTIEPRHSEIKTLLAAGVKVAGVSNARKETVASVRVGRQPGAIEV